MPFINVNNAKLYYEEEGSGDKVLVFGHSMLFNLRMFDQQVAHLKNEYRCIRFDFRGHGKSESTINGYDLDNLTEDAAELIKSLNCSPCHFIGFSMGGMVAMRIALKYPDLIQSLVLIDTSSEPQPKELKNTLMLFVAKNFGLKPISGQVLSMFFGKKFLEDPERKEERKIWKNHFENNNRKGLVKAVNGVLSRTGITEKLEMIKQPTTIMVGDKDQLTEVSISKILHSHINNSSMEIIPDAGHMSPVEEPDMVNSLISSHLEDYYKS